MASLLRYGSVCSGIEAATCAWHPLGWQAAWLAEIEPFPSAVLAHHYPTVPNLGDMTSIADRVLAGDVEAPDILTGGTPCQAFSVAGLRKGLDDARGQLSLAFCRLANAIDAVRSAREQPPAIVVWENVPGVLSDKGNAFGCFLAGLAGEDAALVPPGGRWSNAGLVVGPTRTVCWRVLDAQYFGVAQRRRRVWVVASAREGFDPAAVLLEFDGVRRDSAPSREAGEGFAHDAAPCLTKSGRGVERTGDTRGQDPVVACFGGNNTSGPIPVAPALNANRGCHNPGDFEAGALVAFHPTQDPISSTDGTTHAMGCGSKGGTATVAVAIGTDCYNGAITGDVAATLGTPGSSVNASGPTVMQPAVAFQQNTRDEVRLMGGDGQIAGCLAAEPGMKQQNYIAQPVQTAMQVRRLTPEECEKLQGFPVGHTKIPWRNKPADECPDGPRYKALGNSWAVPCAAWIGRRIVGALA